MKTHLYVLAPKGTQIVEDPAPVHGASRVAVTGDDWYGARGQALRHALGARVDVALVLCGQVQLYWRPHDGQPMRANTNHLHGLWYYLERLAARWGHVYVPPLGMAEQCGPRRWRNRPVLPMVAAYNLKDLQAIDDWDGPLGQALCDAGRDSFTLWDFFYYSFGPNVLHETGSPKTWRDGYEAFISART